MKRGMKEEDKGGLCSFFRMIDKTKEYGINGEESEANGK